ncbi:MAG TPA: penicillin-binding protein 2, partial [Burkholderiaceae bacterium]|nr:penicillin-binding protein 2 [Burkholderiaceae bacterium]
MKLLRNPEREVFHFRTRWFVASGAVLAGFALLLGRFTWLQVVRHEDFYARAEQNRIALVPVSGNRGLIKDRNGTIIAKNYSAYTLEIEMDKVHNVDATIDELSKVVPIEPRDRRRFHKLIEDTKRLDSVPIRTRLTDEEVARFAAQRYRFPGVELRARLFRQYPLGETASHVLGYIGRVSISDEQRIDQFSNPADYNGTEYIGKVGVESSYEEYLHGTTGFEQVEITAGGHPVRTLARTPSEPGSNLILSIDIHLQELAEKAFGERRGALIAIEPATGDVLAFVSKPTFDPNLFVDGIDPLSWDGLNNSPDKPLLNRALRGTYPIGSTYKPFLALAALELGKRRPDSVTYDPGYFWYAGHEFREGGHIPKGGYGNVDLHRSIVVSSDVYYYVLANDLGVDAIHDFMKP